MKSADETFMGWWSYELGLALRFEPLLERMRAEGKAILVVSGELEDLRSCDRVLVMRHGGIVAEHAAGWSDNALVASIEGI